MASTNAFHSVNLVIPASSLFFSTRNSKDLTRESANSTRFSKFSRIKNRVEFRNSRVTVNLPLSGTVYLKETHFTHPDTGSSIRSRGSCKSFHISIFLCCPSSLETSILVLCESVQKRFFAIQSTARPSGNIRSTVTNCSTPEPFRNALLMVFKSKSVQ